MRQLHAFLGDFYHPHAPIHEWIRKTTTAIGHIQLKSFEIQDFEHSLDQSPDILLIFKENRLNPEDIDDHYWLTPAIDEKLAHYVKNGGKLIAIHSALASYPTDSHYQALLKGKFISKPNKPALVKYASAQVQGRGYNAFFDYEVLDEHYFVHVETEETHVFLQSMSEHGTYEAGWHHEYGKGKVVCLTLGHTTEALNHPQSQSLLTYAINYCLEATSIQ